MASTRRLAAILAADVAGYSRLMGQDEEGTHERLKAPVFPALKTRAPTREPNGRWLPGHSGNPDGRNLRQSPDYKLCRELAREFSQHNIERMKHLAETTEDDRVQYMARTWLDEKAWGKTPAAYDPAEDAPPQVDVLFLSPEERQAIRDMLDRARRRKLAQQQQSEIAGDVGGGGDERRE